MAHSIAALDLNQLVAVADGPSMIQRLDIFQDRHLLDPGEALITSSAMIICPFVHAALVAEALSADAFMV